MMQHVATQDRERIKRLRALAAQLERLPPSRARDRLLREAHHRAVAVDTGVPSLSCWREAPGDEQVALFQNLTLRPAPRGR